jgi:hypothetical protein
MLIVRGDRVIFIRAGAEPLNPQDKGRERYKPADEVKPPPGFVLVHDPKGEILERCDFYVLPYQKLRNNCTRIAQDVRNIALGYYGRSAKLQTGDVDIPDGPWHRVCEIGLIRYRRHGKHAGHFQHPYEFPVGLFDCTKPLAWRLELPTGCSVTDHGFEWP